MHCEKPFSEHECAMIDFAQQLIRIRSVFGHERELAEFIKARMEQLDYDAVEIDAMGNVIGRIGAPQRPAIILDAHMDTVEVNDAERWSRPPFGGEIHDGFLYGRGAADMKSSLAACVYAAVAARQAVLDKGKTAYITCTVCEECCDGEGLRYVLTEGGIKPFQVMICEPSGNRIMLGHQGKAQIRIVTHGISAHGAAPQLGKNAVYEMAGIIDRVEQLNQELQKRDDSGTLTLSDIRCTCASPNAVPDTCSISLDRRLAFAETERTVTNEMESLIRAKQAEWAYDEVHMKSWTGYDIHYRPLHMPWRISMEHPLAASCTAAYRKAFADKEPVFDYWNFSTNAVAPVSMGIPTIGFGPGDPLCAHTVDERCNVEEILEAFRFYAVLLETI